MQITLFIISKLHCSVFRMLKKKFTLIFFMFAGVIAVILASREERVLVKRFKD